MKNLLMMSGIAFALTCCLLGCGSQLGGPVYDDERSSVQNEITKKDMNNYINPSKGVYK